MARDRGKFSTDQHKYRGQGIERRRHFRFSGRNRHFAVISMRKISYNAATVED